VISVRNLSEISIEFLALVGQPKAPLAFHWTKHLSHVPKALSFAGAKSNETKGQNVRQERCLIDHWTKQQHPFLLELPLHFFEPSLRDPARDDLLPMALTDGLLHVLMNYHHVELRQSLSVDALRVRHEAWQYQEFLRLGTQSLHHPEANRGFVAGNDFELSSSA
jgi:hypothetical protein